MVVIVVEGEVPIVVIVLVTGLAVALVVFLFAVTDATQSGINRLINDIMADFNEKIININTPNLQYMIELARI